MPMPIGNTASEVQKVGDYYASGMDEKAIEAARIKPLEEEMKRIDAMKDRNDVLNKIARSAYIGVTHFSNLSPARMTRDSTHEIAQALPGRAWAAGPRLLHKDG